MFRAILPGPSSESHIQAFVDPYLIHPGSLPQKPWNLFDHFIPVP
ncbi:hypothetical protein SAMN06265360_111157 [Haloechinothrix alba]|uniref:Uncharacterized protein n=1 Tax=Haloechinothrix alba TaxID=664784 RepID=A0A238XR79_9PSEU|nr:hypothetical protein SAMN06265360_111157 [Haloechinothrix alba]